MIEAGLLAALGLGATCDAISPRDYERYSSAAGLVIGRGDVDEGRAVFVDLRCHSCHTVDGIGFPRIGSSATEPIVLGGEVAELPTDGYLATAVVNPAHDLAPGYPREAVTENGRSRMTDYGDFVTIRQLKDLVAFLHSRYHLPEP